MSQLSQRLLTETLEDIFAGKTQQEKEAMIAEENYEAARECVRLGNFDDAIKMFDIIEKELPRGIERLTLLFSGRSLEGSLSSSRVANKMSFSAADNNYIFFEALRRGNVEMVSRCATLPNADLFLIALGSGSRKSQKTGFNLGRLMQSPDLAKDECLKRLSSVDLLHEIAIAEFYDVANMLLKNISFLDNLLSIQDEERHKISRYVDVANLEMLEKELGEFYCKMFELFPNELKGDIQGHDYNGFMRMLSQQSILAPLSMISKIIAHWSCQEGNQARIHEVKTNVCAIYERNCRDPLKKEVLHYIVNPELLAQIGPIHDHTSRKDAFCAEIMRQIYVKLMESPAIEAGVDAKHSLASVVALDVFAQVWSKARNISLIRDSSLALCQRGIAPELQEQILAPSEEGYGGFMPDALHGYHPEITENFQRDEKTKKHVQKVVCEVFHDNALTRSSIIDRNIVFVNGERGNRIKESQTIYGVPQRSPEVVAAAAASAGQEEAGQDMSLS